MKTNKPIDEALVEVLFGEADESQRHAVEQAISEDAELASEYQALAKVVEAMEQMEKLSLPVDFEARLKQKWHEQQALEAGRGLRRRAVWRWVETAGLAALVVLAAVAWFLVGPGDGGTVAWADVVHAMDQVRFFHASVFEHDDDDELEAMDVFYRDPNTWRLHHRRAVVFATAAGSGEFDIAKKEWRNRSDGFAAGMLPGDFAKNVEEAGMLNAALSFIFRGDVPPGEPVLSAVEAQDHELLVFDYAHDPNKQWARIWVLKSSRLPIRIKCFMPARGEEMLVDLDYSDPRSDRFFDIANFAEEAKAWHRKKPSDFFTIGSEPVDGIKPRSADQLMQTQGIRPPKVLEVVVNKENHVLLMTDDPENRSLQGGEIAPTFYGELRDNWGNLYHRYYDKHGDPWAQYYLPIPPYQQGEGRHQLKVVYTAWSHHVDPAEQIGIGYDKVLYEQWIDLPEATAEGLPAGWPTYENMVFFEDQALRIHYSTGRPSLEQLEMVNQLLEQRPDSGQLVGCKMRALEELGAEAEADAFFEETMKDKALQETSETGEISEPLSRYLSHQWAHGERDAVLAVIEKAGATLARLAAEKAGDGRLEDFKRQYDYYLSAWLKLAPAQEALQEGPKPQVAEVVRSRDGYVYLLLQMDKAKKAAFSEFGFGSSWSNSVIGREWELLSQHWKQRPEASQVLLRLRGKGDKLTLRLGTALEPSSGRISPPVDATVDIEVTVPPASVETEEQLDAHFAWILEAWSDRVGPFSQYLFKGRMLMGMQRWEAALEALRTAAATPDEPLSQDPDRAELEVALRWRERRVLQTQIGRCLAELGRLDEAVAHFDEVAAQLLAADALKQRRSLLVSAQVGLATDLIECGQLERARAFIAQVNTQRPDFRALSNLHRRVETGSGGMSGIQDRSAAAQLWTEVDRVTWRLEQAEAKLDAGDARPDAGAVND
jgi:tetratricopeptide (TPR) repeat protein